MGFTSGRYQDKLCLVAICDFCGEVLPAERVDWECILPKGWVRIGQRKEVGSLYTIPIYRSNLACPECQRSIEATNANNQLRGEQALYEIRYDL